MNWDPKTTLKDGLSITYDYFSKLTLGLCLPLTSRGCKSLGEVKDRLKKLVLDVSSHIFIGIDEDDPLYNLPEIDVSWFESIFDRPCYIRKFTKEEGRRMVLQIDKKKMVPDIYGMYNLLINDAYDDGMEYFVLWGDDIKTKNNNWLPNVVEKFKKYDSSGLGVVALIDLSNPGMPTFPIVGRKHVEIFGGFCPPYFINQDADPWVYAVYRRFGYASFVAVTIENEIGGAIETGVDARYERVHLENWRDIHIEPAVDKIAEYTGLVKYKSVVTLDVITPTYRTNLKLLENIIRLKEAISHDKNANVRFIIVVDNPWTEVRQELKRLALI